MAFSRQGPERSSGSEQQSPDRSRERLRLRLALSLTATYTVVEWIGGFLTGSLALVADAGHMLTDVGSLGLALGALWMAQRPATARHTYAYGRVEILAALVNGLFMWALVIWIAAEALRRLRVPQPIDAESMMVIAVGGLAINGGVLWLLHRDAGEERSLNLRGALLHVLGDLLGSVGLLVAGIVILTTRWLAADPIASFAIVGLILFSSWRVIRDAVHILLEGAPRGLDVEAMIGSMRALPDVAGVHDLHVWMITSGYPALSAHVVCAPGARSEMLLARVNRLLREEFGVTHTTIQIESTHLPDQEEPMTHPIARLD